MGLIVVVKINIVVATVTSIVWARVVVVVSHPRVVMTVVRCPVMAMSAKNVAPMPKVHRMVTMVVMHIKGHRFDIVVWVADEGVIVVFDYVEFRVFWRIIMNMWFVDRAPVVGSIYGVDRVRTIVVDIYTIGNDDSLFNDLCTMETAGDKARDRKKQDEAR